MKFTHKPATAIERAPEYVRAIAPYVRRQADRRGRARARSRSGDDHQARVEREPARTEPEGRSPRSRAAAAELTRYPDGNGFALKDALSRAAGRPAGTDRARQRQQRRPRAGDAGVPACRRSRRVLAARVRRLSARHAGARRDWASRCPRRTTATTSTRCGRRSRRARASCSSPIRTTRREPGSRRSAVEAFIAGVPQDVIVVLDEAYNEYLDPAEQARCDGVDRAVPESRRLAHVFQGVRPRGAARRLRRHERRRRRPAESRAPAVQRQLAGAGGGDRRARRHRRTSRKAAR